VVYVARAVAPGQAHECWRLHRVTCVLHGLVIADLAAATRVVSRLERRRGHHEATYVAAPGEAKGEDGLACAWPHPTASSRAAHPCW
jgi:hypothetical protein